MPSRQRLVEILTFTINCVVKKTHAPVFLSQGDIRTLHSQFDVVSIDLSFNMTLYAFENDAGINQI